MKKVCRWPLAKACLHSLSLTIVTATARAGELSPGRAYSRTSRDERRNETARTGNNQILGLFLTIKLPGLRIVATEAYVALLRTIMRLYNSRSGFCWSQKRTDFELIGRT